MYGNDTEMAEQKKPYQELISHILGKYYVIAKKTQVYDYMSYHFYHSDATYCPAVFPEYRHCRRGHH